MQANLANLPRSIEVYELALEGLARVDEWVYRQNRNLPSVLDPRAKVRYERETGEIWRHVADVLRDGWGDCEDLAAARVGELRSKGERRARVIVVRTGPKMTHAIVKRANGKTEDPSRALGMGRERVVTMRQMEAEAIAGDAGWGEDDGYGGEYEGEEDEVIEGDYDEIGADPSQSAEVTWTLDRTPNGWKGTVRVPLDAGRCLLVTRNSPVKGPAGKKDAATRALGAAANVLDSPVAKALIPPQAQMALNLVRNPALRNAVNGTISKLRGLF